MSYSTGAAWMEGKVIPVSEAKISVFDWGLTRSDITYDVVHVWEGAFFRLEDYLDRFMISRVIPEPAPTIFMLGPFRSSG